MNVIRIVLLILVPLAFLLRAVNIVFVIQHWEGAGALGYFNGTVSTLALILAFIYALPARKPQRPTFDSF